MRAGTTTRRLYWAPRTTADQVVARLGRRLPDATELTAAPYHHPFLGFAFAAAGQHGRAHVLVDQVGGRAFLTDPWDGMVGPDTEHEPGRTAAIKDPLPRIEDDVAYDSARRLLAAVLQRRHRLGLPGRIDLCEGPVQLAKPNWWVTGRRGATRVEIVVDAITGLHYTFAA